MNVQTMYTLLRARIGNPSLVDVPNTKLITMLDLAYQDIADRYRFHRKRKRCQFYTLKGQARYDLPADLISLFRVSDTTNNVKLEKIGDRQLSSRADATAVGKPTRYVRYRDWVELDPIPDYGNGLGVSDPSATGYLMELFYKYTLPILTADGDIPTIPTGWHIGIVVLAKYYYYEDQGDAPKANLAMEAWKLWVADKPTEIDEESVDIDSGVEILTLSQNFTPRQDFNHAD